VALLGRCGDEGKEQRERLHGRRVHRGSRIRSGTNRARSLSYAHNTSTVLLVATGNGPVLS
jgi:hypothetical protein